MNPAVYGILAIIIRGLVDQNRALLIQQGQQAVQNQLIGGALGAMLMRPHNLILGPLRIVGRGVGFIFGWGPVAGGGNPFRLNMRQNEIPFFYRFDLHNNGPQQLHNLNIGQGANQIDPGALHIFAINNTCYNCIIFVVEVLGIMLVIWLTYRIARRVYFFLRRDWLNASKKDEYSHQEKVNKRIEQLRIEQQKLSSESKDSRSHK